MAVPPWFVGDPADPRAAAIRAALPADARSIATAGRFDAEWPADMAGATVVIHRSRLARADRAALAGLLARGPARVVLCVGPHARYEDLESWAALVDRIVPESIAAEVIGRYGSATSSRGPGGVGLLVVADEPELSAALVEAGRACGYAARPVLPGDRDGLADDLPMLYAVPALDPDWPRRLEEQAARRPVVALVGFADGDDVATAKGRGAAACLELPCDLGDLAFVLDRVIEGQARSGRHRADSGGAACEGPRGTRAASVPGSIGREGGASVR